MNQYKLQLRPTWRWYGRGWNYSERPATIVTVLAENFEEAVTKAKALVEKRIGDEGWEPTALEITPVEEEEEPSTVPTVSTLSYRPRLNSWRRYTP